VSPPSWAEGEYGDLDGDGTTDEAAVGVVCSNGGGTAAGQLGFFYVIVGARENVLRLMGVVTPRQPLDPDAGHVPLLGSVEILRGRLLAQEAWYGPSDGTCCPSGRAATIWTYASGKLRPSRTIVVLRPSRQLPRSCKRPQPEYTPWRIAFPFAECARRALGNSHAPNENPPSCGGF
jgi:hypothetical protein